MDQHPVPRQITTFEFKLIGFMTLRQFLYLVVFFPIGFVVYKIIPFNYINMLVGALVGAVGLVFAFIPIQDRPFEVWLRHFIKRLTSPTQYIYHKQQEIIPILANLYFTSDPHLTLTHVETKEKLNKYLEDQKIKSGEKISQTILQKDKQKIHIDDLLQQTKNTDPLQIKKADVSLAGASGNQSGKIDTIKQPFITGLIKNRRQIPLPGILVSLKDLQGNQLRLLKTNPHGIFATYSPLSEGDYRMEISDSKGNYFFDTMDIHIGSGRQKPFLFYSKEML